MSSSYLDWRCFLCRDEMKAPLFLVFLFTAETLKQDVWLIGFADGHHFHVLVFKPNQLREGELADLALELSEVVRGCDSLQFLLDLAVDPGLETADVDESACSLALARRNQRISFCLFIA